MKDEKETRLSTEKFSLGMGGDTRNMEGGDETKFKKKKDGNDAIKSNMRGKKTKRTEVPLVLKMTCCCLWCCCCLLHCFYCCLPATGAKKHNTKMTPTTPTRSKR